MNFFKKLFTKEKKESLDLGLKKSNESFFNKISKEKKETKVTTKKVETKVANK